MTSDIEIKGGANDFEAAVVAAVVDRIRADEAEAIRGRSRSSESMPAWVRALAPRDPRDPRSLIRPD